MNRSPNSLRIRLSPSPALLVLSLLALPVPARANSSFKLAKAKTRSVSAPSSAPSQRRTFGPTNVELQWRIATPRGGLRVFRPKATSAAQAVVLYVHGYGATVDDSWQEHQLAQQFRASGKNAVFISVEAPAGPDDTVRFRRLDRVLALVEARLGRTLPGYVVAMGHSGAYRTLLPWLRCKKLKQVILLDSLYSSGARFGAWLRRHPARRFTLIFRGHTPSKNGRWLAQRLGKLTVRSSRIPKLAQGLTPRQRRARALFVHSQYSHLGIVTSGHAIPLILRDRI